MRKLFFIVLVSLLIGVGVVAIIETDPGYVLITYGNYTLETSLWVGLLLLLLVVLLVYALLSLIYRFVSGQRTLVNWLGTRKAHHALRISTRGVISFTEGNWAQARKQLESGSVKNEAALINYLLAARSSAQLQEPEKISEYLHAAEGAEPGAAVAVELTLAEIRLQAGEYEQALAALKKARINPGKHPHALALLCRAYEGMQDWDALLALLPDLVKYKQLTSEELSGLESRVHSHRLELSVAGTNPTQENVQTVWTKVPTSLKQDSAMLSSYVRLLIQVGAADKAEKIILRALKHQWDASLVRQYGLLEGENASRQLTQAERWLPEHNDDPQLLLCLARLSARDKLWGKARDYFESSYRLEPGSEVCAELGRLLTGLGEPKVAAAYYREGLMALENDLPGLPMPDKLTAPHQSLV